MKPGRWWWWGGGGLLPSKRQERMSCKRLCARRLFVYIRGKDKFGRACVADFQVGGGGDNANALA